MLDAVSEKTAKDSAPVVGRYQPLNLSRTVHACDVTSSRDQVVVYRTGEELIKNGSHCCGPRRSR